MSASSREWSAACSGSVGRASVQTSVGLTRAVVAVSCRLDDESRTRLMTRASVFARVSPGQKLRIIAGLQKAGRVVGHDRRRANAAAVIRLAMSVSAWSHGSSSARTAADLVFTEPDVSVILDALVEGRAMWRRGLDQVLRTITEPLAVLSRAVPAGPIPVAPGTGALAVAGVIEWPIAARRRPRLPRPCAAGADPPAADTRGIRDERNRA